MLPGRCWRPSQGAWGKARRRGRTTGCRRTWWTSARTRGGATSLAWWSRTCSRGGGHRATKALPDKRAETVTAAAAEIIPGLVQEEGNYVVTTDLGNEFQGLEEALPEGVVHRQKDPTDRNATAVVDRAIQTLKKDLAGKVARDGGGWAEHVDEAKRKPTTPGTSGHLRNCARQSFLLASRLRWQMLVSR